MNRVNLVKKAQKIRKKRDLNASLMKSLYQLCEHEKEVGGGVNFDKNGRLKNITIFTSNDDGSIEFDDVYDVEFHTHPVKDDYDESMKLLSRSPSAADVASIFVSGREEIIISKGYVFHVKIDHKLFEKTKRVVREKYHGKRVDLFKRYVDYFTTIRKKTWKKEYKMTDPNDVRKFINNWRKELYRHGIIIKRVKKDEAIFDL